MLRRDKRMMVGEPGLGASSEPATSNGSPFSQPALESSTGVKFETAGTTPETVPARSRWSAGSPTSAPGPVPAHGPIQRSHSHPNPAPDATSSSLPTSLLPDSRSLRVASMFAGPGERRPGATSYGLEVGQAMMNRTAVELLSPAISNSHDALHLLSEAAGRTEDLNRYAARHSTSSFASPMSPLNQTTTPKSTAGSFSRPSRPSGGMSLGPYFPANGSHASDQPIADGRGPGDSTSAFPDAGFLDAVKAWSRLRFVRAGWLTVEEAMAYVA